MAVFKGFQEHKSALAYWSQSCRCRKMEKAMDQDAAIYAEVLHPDFTFVRHQSGTEMSRDQMVEMLNMMMSNDKVVILDSRCIYENDDVLVEHSLMDFPDGSREAVMGVHVKKDDDLQD